MAFYNVKDGNLTPVAGGTLYADCPVGTILAYGGTTPPAGWFICDGTALNRTSFAELFSVIGTQFGSGNGSSTFNIPDMREMVPRGAGTQSLKTVGTHNAKNVGEFQDDRIQNITGTLKISGDYGATFKLPTDYTGTGAIRATEESLPYGSLSSGGTDNSNTGFTFDASRVVRTGTTTEVKSIGVNYIIKATRIAVPADFVSSIEDTLSDMGIGTIMGNSDGSMSIESGSSKAISITLTTGKWIVTANTECNVDVDITITASLTGSNGSVSQAYVSRGSALRGGGLCLTNISNVTTSTATTTLTIYNDSSSTYTYRGKIQAIKVA